VGRLEPHNAPIILVAYDPDWPGLFGREAERLRSVLGDVALRIEHVGSTSVPGLMAKPIIDILLVVPDSADEPCYVPQVQGAGYVLRIREPEWFEHRLFKGPDTAINLHVFGVGAAEVERMLCFRDRLRHDDAVRNRYERVKRELAIRTWRHVRVADEVSDSITRRPGEYGARLIPTVERCPAWAAEAHPEGARDTRPRWSAPRMGRPSNRRIGGGSPSGSTDQPGSPAVPARQRRDSEEWRTGSCGLPLLHRHRDQLPAARRCPRCRRPSTAAPAGHCCAPVPAPAWTAARCTATSPTPPESPGSAGPSARTPCAARSARSGSTGHPAARHPAAATPRPPRNHSGQPRHQPRRTRATRLPSGRRLPRRLGQLISRGSGGNCPA